MRGIYLRVRADQVISVYMLIDQGGIYENALIRQVLVLVQNSSVHFIIAVDGWKVILTSKSCVFLSRVFFRPKCE